MTEIHRPEIVYIHMYLFSGSGQLGSVGLPVGRIASPNVSIESVGVRDELREFCDALFVGVSL